jgi:hypothetical protein
VCVQLPAGVCGDSGALGQAPAAAIARRFRVMAPDGASAAEGVADGPAVEAPLGVYRLVIDSVPPPEIPEVKSVAVEETRAVVT